MSCFSSNAATPTVAEPDPAKHVNYNLGMVLGVDDFKQEFAYLSGRDQWMARDLIGYGTVRGLQVTIDEDISKGPRVVVDPGVAVSPRGQMICVSSAQCAYLRDALESRADEVNKFLGSPPSISVQLYVVLCYRDCPTDNVPIAGEPCRSEDQLMAPSRVTDNFRLELRFEKPNQREEEAVRDFVRWLKQVQVSKVAPSTPLRVFLDEIRAAARPWLSSPPASPPSSPLGDFMSGSPTSVINSADTCEYMRAAFRIWVTELRPKWIARWHGCAATHFDVDDQRDENCVLLAELTVPIVSSSPGFFTVADTPDVLVSEHSRPFVVHLRVLQEWLWCGATCCDAGGLFGSPPGGGPAALIGPGASFVGVPELLPRYEIVAAGIVGTLDDATVAPVFNNLTATLQPDNRIALNFRGYTPPTGRRSFQYIVKALVVFQAGAERATVSFSEFDRASIGILMTVSNVNNDVLRRLQLMVEISRYEARRVEPPIA
jgi:hypothetical protein